MNDREVGRATPARRFVRPVAGPLDHDKGVAWADYPQIRFPPRSDEFDRSGGG